MTTREAPQNIEVGDAKVPAGPSLDLGVPITEVLLRHLPGPRWALIVVWAIAVVITPFVLAGAKWLTEASDSIDPLGELGPQGILTSVVALLLVGVARLVDQASALRPDIDRLTNNGNQTSRAARRWDFAGPVALTALVVLVASWSSWSTGHGLVYHYFSSKNELLLAVLESFSFLPELWRLLDVSPEREDRQQGVSTAKSG